VWRREALAGHSQQFDLETQSGMGRDHVARAAFAIGQRRRAGQAGLAADLHALHPFGPAADDTVERKARRLPRLCELSNSRPSGKLPR
jgi:hypothetical protein